MVSPSRIRLLGLIHEVYYAPQIVALQLGYFADEGLEVEFDPSGDPEGVPRAVARGRADFGLSGLWHPWVHAQRGLPFVAFANLNQQVPMTLFGRSPAAQFDWTSLKGGTLLHTSALAPSPWCAIQELLRLKGVDLGALRLLIGYPQAEAEALFAGGYGDVLELFGLGASPVLADPNAHSLVRWGSDLGTIPWSVYFATEDGLRERRGQAIALTRALARAERWLHGREAHEITDVLAPSFPGVEEERIRLLVAAYADQDQWPLTPSLDPESVERWRHILVRSGLLAATPLQDRIVDGSIAAEALAA